MPHHRFPLIPLKFNTDAHSVSSSLWESWASSWNNSWIITGSVFVDGHSVYWQLFSPPYYPVVSGCNFHGPLPDVNLQLKGSYFLLFVKIVGQCEFVRKDL